MSSIKKKSLKIRGVATPSTIHPPLEPLMQTIKVNATDAILIMQHAYKIYNVAPG